MYLRYHVYVDGIDSGVSHAGLCGAKLEAWVR